MKDIMDPISFELCVESLQAARAAELGGADRIELCSQLESGGASPSAAKIKAVIAAVSLPVYVLVRPRPGDFVFSNKEYDQMRRQIVETADAGAHGVALGILCAEGCVDIERTAALVELARPMGVTFHRAFDETVDLNRALEDVIATGADSLLTSGGAADVLSGAATIGTLAERAGDRIRIIAGGGLRLSNLRELVRRSGVLSLHGSLTRESRGAEQADPRALERSVREALRMLREGYQEQAVAVRKS